MSALPNLQAANGKGGIDYIIHHLLSHTNGADWLKVNRFFLEQLSYLAGKLDSIKENGQSVLDNSTILYCSSMLTGSHEATRLPVVLVGGLGGTIRTGRALDCGTRPERKMCNLFLSLLDRYGVKLPEFGDAKNRLEGI